MTTHMLKNKLCWSKKVELHERSTISIAANPTKISVAVTDRFIDTVVRPS